MRLILSLILFVTILPAQVWRDSLTYTIPSPAGKAVRITQLAIGDTNSRKTAGMVAYQNGSFYVANGTYYVLVGGGSGIISLNGLLTNAQVFAFDTTFGTFGWSSSGSTHTLRMNFPYMKDTTFPTLRPVVLNAPQVITSPKYYTARQTMTSVATDTIDDKSGGGIVGTANVKLNGGLSATLDNYWSGDTLKRFQWASMLSAVDTIKASSILFIGDSHTANMTIEMSEAMWDAVGYAGIGWVPFQNNRYNIVGVTLTGGWTQVTANSADSLWGIDGRSIYSSSTNDSVYYVPSSAQFNYARIWYYQTPYGGTFDVRLNGATTATVNTSGSAGLNYYIVPGISVANNIISAKVASGRVVLYGIDTYDTSATGIVVHNLGHSGTTVAQWTMHKTYLASFLNVVSPDYTNLWLGYNDIGNGTAATTVSAIIDTFVTTVRNNNSQKEVGLMAGIKRGSLGNVDNTTFNASYDSLKSLMQNISFSRRTSFFNAFDLLPLYSIGYQYGLYNDTVHLSTAGRKTMSGLFRKYLFDGIDNQKGGRLYSSTGGSGYNLTLDRQGSSSIDPSILFKKNGTNLYEMRAQSDDINFISTSGKATLNLLPPDGSGSQLTMYTKTGANDGAWNITSDSTKLLIIPSITGSHTIDNNIYFGSDVSGTSNLYFGTGSIGTSQFIDGSKNLNVNNITMGTGDIVSVEQITQSGRLINSYAAGSGLPAISSTGKSDLNLSLGDGLGTLGISTDRVTMHIGSNNNHSSLNIGQSSTAAASLFWIYNATENSAYGRLTSLKGLAFGANNTAVAPSSATDMTFSATTFTFSGAATFSGKVSPNGVTTSADGVVSTPDTVVWTARATSIGSQNFANTATGHLYKISYYLHTTTTGTGTVLVSFAWNDGAAKTSSSATADLTSTGNAGLATGDQVMYIASGTPSWTTTVAGGGSTEQYALRMVLTRLY